MIINIAYACDEAYMEQQTVSLTSLFENNKQIEKIHIYFIDMGITEKSADELKKLANKYGRKLEIIPLNGSVEIAPLIGISDVLVDIVQTGTTLKENGLKVLEELCPVSARVVVNRDSMLRDNYRIMKLLSNMESALRS